MEKFGSEMENIRIRDKHPGSATVELSEQNHTANKKRGPAVVTHLNETETGRTHKGAGRLRDAPTAVRLVDAPTAGRLVDAPTAVRLGDAPAAGRLGDAPTTGRLVDVPTTARLWDVPTAVRPH